MSNWKLVIMITLQAILINQPIKSAAEHIIITNY